VEMQKVAHLPVWRVAMRIKYFNLFKRPQWDRRSMQRGLLKLNGCFLLQ
jgi:hypothetical protein